MRPMPRLRRFALVVPTPPPRFILA
jgi:hypothetical protein